MQPIVSRNHPEPSMIRLKMVLKEWMCRQKWWRTPLKTLGWLGPLRRWELLFWILGWWCLKTVPQAKRYVWLGNKREREGDVEIKKKKKQTNNSTRERCSCRSVICQTNIYKNNNKRPLMRSNPDTSCRRWCQKIILNHSKMWPDMKETKLNRTGKFVYIPVYINM